MRLSEFAIDRGGDDPGEDPYKYPKPQHYNRSVDFFGRFEADHFDKEDTNDATGEFKGYWGNTQIAYFKFDNPAKTSSDDPGMGWYYEPESIADDGDTAARPAAFDNSEQRKQQELSMIDAFLKSGQTPKPGSPIHALMKRHGMAEGGEGSGRRTADAWDTSPGRVGRVEKTAQGIRHHADPSRYGGTETEPELDRLDKGKVNAMDKALDVKWDRESKRYYSPIKVDETKPREKEADYGDDYQDMVARVKKLAGMGPLKTVYDPQKRVYKNVPVAVQPAQQPKKERQ
jgi:hypothetical protein